MANGQWQLAVARADLKLTDRSKVKATWPNQLTFLWCCLLLQRKIHYDVSAVLWPLLPRSLARPVIMLLI